MSGISKMGNSVVAAKESFVEGKRKPSFSAGSLATARSAVCLSVSVAVAVTGPVALATKMLGAETVAVAAGDGCGVDGDGCGVDGRGGDG